MTSSAMLLRVLSIVAILTRIACAADAPCDQISSTVIGSNQIFVHCLAKSNVAFSPQSNLYQLWRIQADWDKDPRKQGQNLTDPATTQITPLPRSRFIVQTPVSLAADQLYLVVVTGFPGKADLLAIVSTKGDAKADPSGPGAKARSQLVVTSPVEFTCGSQTSVHVTETIRGPSLVPGGGKDAGKTKIHDAQAKLPGGSCDGRQPGDPPVRTDVTAYGTISIELQGSDRFWQTGGQVEVSGLHNIFGAPVVAKGKLQLPDTPKGKDDASYFINFSHAAATHQGPTFTLESKIAPELAVVHGFAIKPNIQTDISHNLPKAPDTLKFGLDVVRSRVFDSKVLPRLDWTIGPLFEGNRTLDKKNILGTFQVQPYFAKLWETKEARTCEKAADDHVPCDKFKPESFGYGIEFPIGFEAGDALSLPSLTNKAKTKTLTVPGYSIVRTRPKAHAMIEFGHLTFDLSGTYRYLLQTELVGLVTPADKLVLKSVSGWQLYHQLTSSWSFDSAKRISLSVTYKNGADAPTYVYTNTVSSGISLKY